MVSGDWTQRYYIDWVISLSLFQSSLQYTEFVRLSLLLLISSRSFKDIFNQAWWVIPITSALRRLKWKDCLLQVQSQAGIQSELLSQLYHPPQTKAKTKDNIPYPWLFIFFVKHANVCESPFPVLWGHKPTSVIHMGNEIGGGFYCCLHRTLVRGWTRCSFNVG